jgi:hypothetical protein
LDIERIILAEEIPVIRATCMIFMLMVLLTAWPSPAQELSLPQYLQQLKSAPGTTLSEKMDFLSGMGVRLSSQGRRDLDNAPSGLGSRPSAWSAPRPDAGWSQPENSSRGWNSTTSRNGKFTNYTFDNGVTGSSSRVGNQTYYNFSNGLSGVNTEVGDHSYQSFNNGLSGNTSRVGNQTYQNWSDGSSATSSRVGTMIYHNYSNGVTGTSTQVGDITYHNFSDGRRCTTTRIGRQTNTSCQ